MKRNKLCLLAFGQPCVQFLLILLGLTILNTSAWAIRAPDANSSQPAKVGHFVHAAELDVHPSIGPTQSLTALSPTNTTIAGFVKRYPGHWVVTWDSRGDRPNMFSGGGIPLLPGRGNNLSRASLGLTASEPMDLATISTLLDGFIKQNADVLKTQGLEFKVDNKSAQPFGKDQSHWFIDFQQVKDGLAVEGAHLFFRIAAGNIVQFGTYLVAPVEIDTRPQSSASAAFTQAFAALNFPAGTQVVDWLDRGSLSIRPYMPDGAAMLGHAFRGAPGTGYAHKLVWRFVFRVDGDRTTYQVLVDARTDRVIDVRDINEYAAAIVDGGVYPAGQPNTVSEIIQPFTYANVSNGSTKTTDIGGMYDYSGAAASTTLNGAHINISDACGNPSLGDSSTGNLHLGTSGGTDCTKPGNNSSTHSARNAFYYLTQINRKAASFYPGNSWLNGKVTANVNIDDLCNAYWDGSALNFFKSGIANAQISCANTGELSGVFMHEFGHGIQQNVAGQSPNDFGTGEATGDTFAFLQTRDGCIGNGFFTNQNECLNCSASCTGVRDINQFSQAGPSGFVVTPATITASGGPDCDNGMSCPYLTPQGQPYQGPMGYEGHCESYIASSANWDLAHALADAMGTDAGWQKMDELWYGILPNNTDAYQVASGGKCSTSATVNGCASNNWYNLYLAADDDDGNLGNGTPNACRIWDAFNAHGIACGTRPVCSTIEPGFSLTLTPSSNDVCAPGNQIYSVDTTALGQPPFTGMITLQATGLPTGASAAFSPNPVAPGSSSSLSLTVDGTVGSAAIAFNVAGHATGADDQTVAGTLNVSNGAPAAPALSQPADSATDVSPNANLSWSASAGATSYNVDVATDAAFANIVSTQTNVPGTGTSVNLSAMTTYYWRVMANSTCGAGVYSSAFSFTTGALSFPQPYCDVTFPNGVEPISHVTFAGIDHATSESTTGAVALEDFTNIVGGVIVGQTLPISVEGNTDGPYTNPIRVYVDWNHDGDFADVAETYVLSDLKSSTGADGKKSTGQIAVPATAMVGHTRMRVMKRFGVAGDPCNAAGYGQAEDYTLNVGLGPTIEVAPTSLSLSAVVGASTTTPLSIGNIGGETLNWSIAESVADAMTSPRAAPSPEMFASRDGTGSIANVAAPRANPQRPLALTLDEGFADVETLVTTGGWIRANHSEPLGNSSWAQCGGTAIPPAYDGGSNECVLVNYNSTTGAGTISQWLLTPQITFDAGATASFWTRTATNANYADRLEVRLCTTGDCTNFGTGATDTGDFSTVLLTINPSLQSGPDATGVNGYPDVWTQFTLNGLPASGTGRIAFRYYVTDGGPAGTHSNIIGIDRVTAENVSSVGCMAPSDIPWLSATPSTGATVGGSSSAVTVTADATALAVGTYTANLCVTSDDAAHTLTSVPVSFAVSPAPVTHQVTPSVASGNGAISPNNAQTVNDGETTSFVLTPADGYHIDTVDGTCGGVLSGNDFTTNAVVDDCTVQAHFAANVLVFTTQPVDVAQGDVLGAVVVSEQDGHGNALTNDSGSTVDFSVSVCGGPVNLGNATMVDGVATLTSSQPFFAVASGIIIHAVSSGTLNASADSAGFSVLANIDLLFNDGFEDCRP
ncbi:MAG TPA: choice-of-anchor J domain-containing protein [Rudaea sp.]|nr:choice-of-anchor J domain-containing protein [Rudaea sp.]